MLCDRCIGEGIVRIVILIGPETAGKDFLYFRKPLQSKLLIAGTFRIVGDCQHGAEVPEPAREVRVDQTGGGNQR
ncbi:hypothetical protein ASD02_36130 [Ensifer sp. Root1252]|nr:hypothetical protein ASD00_37755 [Ensifer sp. Root31]KQW41305.1 hypothetical protein ASD02_36130 [Ensifer sp. Root1252]KQW61416.1 hypothetical protein ASD03_36605 [Ensifer sp. Root127]KRC62243.1 hypothetical protein ASE32_36220 [Ensifer sp. Root231]KRC91142.1 hypothetical protein ASE47_36190 [Ensifer sp. Root258]